ncbi:MAG: DUF2007 domain-containing protein [Bacteroidales bacterium]|nr:DUF2007 domain-containing protein [Bacteroidales bacterium]
MKTIKEFPSLFEAQVAQGALENEGINAQILNESSSFPAFATFSKQFAIKLVVSDEDYEKSLEILNHLSDEAAASSAE